MKKVLVLLGGVIVLLVAGVLTGPGFIDWNAYKGDITDAVEAATGRRLSIDGDLKFAVLPTPTLRASGVRLSNIDGAQSPNMLTLKDVRVRVSIAELFQGRIAVERIQLVEPVIALEVLADGRASWDIAPVAATGGATDSVKTDNGQDVGQDVGQDAPGVAISLASLTITKGVVSYRDGARIERIEGVNAEISADSLQGPFTATLSAIVHGLPVEATLRANSIRPDQPIGVNATLGVTGLESRATFSGKVVNPGPAAALDGKLTIEGADAAETIRRITGNAGNAGTAVLARPFSVTGVVLASQKSAALNDMVVRLGDVSATGAINLGLGDIFALDVAVSVNKFDLDEFLAAAKKPAKASKTATNAEKAVAAPQATSPNAAAFALPENVNASLDLTIDVLRYNRGVVRKAGVRAVMSNGSITLDRASALLPGGSDVSALGFLQMVDGAPVFEGEVAAASDNLRAVFDWLSIGTQGVSNDRLRGFSYASKIKASPESVEIPDINIRLDASTMTGALALAIRDRPGVGLRLAIDQLNLDAYLPKSRRSPVASKAPAPSKTPAASKAPAVSKAGSGASGLALLDTFDANFDVGVGRLTVQGATLGKLHAEGLLVGGDMTLKTLRVADAMGVAATFRGDVRGLGGTPAVALDFDVAGTDLTRTFRWLGVKPPLTPKQLGKVTAKGRVEGGLKAVSLKAAVVAAGGKITLNGALQGLDATPEVAIGARIDHPDLAKAVRLFAPAFKPAASNLGALAAAFRMTATAAGLDITDIDAAVGPVMVKGSMSVGLGGTLPRIKATLETGEVLADLFLPSWKTEDTARNRQRKANGLSPVGSTFGGSVNGRWSVEKIDLSGLKGVDADITLTMAGLIVDQIRLGKPHVEFRLKDGQLNVGKVTAGLLGGAVSGAGVIDASTTPPTFTAALHARDLESRDIMAMADIPARLSGPISIEFSGGASGASQSDLIATLKGSARLGGRLQVQVSQEERSAAGALNIVSALLGSKVKELGQVGGASSVLFDAFGKNPATLSGDLAIRNGVVTTQNGRLAGTGAYASIVGAVDLPAWRVDSRTSMFQDGGAAPLIYFDVKGSLDTPGFKPGGDILGRRAPAASQTKSNPLQQVLPGLLGGQSGEGAPKKPKAKDLIRGLLKGLGG